MILEFFQGLSSVDWMVGLQTLLVFILVWYSIKAQTRTDFDWADVIKNRYGKVDPYVVTYLISFGVYTYIVVYLTRTQSLEQMYVVLYLAYGLGMPFAKSVLGAWRPPSINTTNDSQAVKPPK